MENTEDKKTEIKSETQAEPESGSHILSVIGLLIKGTTRDIVNASEKRLESMKNLIIVTFVAPVAALVTGVIIAANSDTVAGVNAGRWFIMVAGFLATLLCGVVLVRAKAYAYVVIGCSKAAKVALNFMPTLETEEVNKYMVYFYGIMAWIAGVCIYAQIIPVWRSVGTALVVATALLGLAAVMAARWYGGKFAKGTLLVLMVGTLAVSTVRLVSPRLLSAMDNASDYALGTDGRTDAEKTLLKKYNEELVGIRARAANECNGKYCNEGDVSRVKELEKNIHLLETGQYWSTEATVAPAPAAVKNGASTVKTEAAPAKAETTSSSQAEKKPPTRSVSKGAGTNLSKAGDPFVALDQFPDIKPAK